MTNFALDNHVHAGTDGTVQFAVEGPLASFSIDLWLAPDDGQLRGADRRLITDALPPETRVGDDRYEVTEAIGRGGSAHVYRATDHRLKRDIAVKITERGLLNQFRRSRFESEARAAAAFHDPSIGIIYDSGDEFNDELGVPFIVMEYIEGRSLADVLRVERDGLPIGRALEIVRDVLRGLATVHRVGAIHGDIAPGNLMISNDGRVKLIDFGEARYSENGRLAHRPIPIELALRSRRVFGTPAHLAPELIRGEPPSPASDLYGLTSVLFALLTGRAPFVATSLSGLLYEKLTSDTPRVSIVRPVAEQVDRVVSKGLSRDPLDRYRTASAMQDDIMRLLADTNRWERRENSVVRSPPTPFVIRKGLGGVPPDALANKRRELVSEESARSPTAPAGAPGSDAQRRLYVGRHHLKEPGEPADVAARAKRSWHFWRH